MLGGRIRGFAKAARHDKRISGRLLTVLIDDQVVQSDDWSMGGIAVTLKHFGPYTTGQRVKGYVGAEANDKFAFVAEVVRADVVNRRLALRFVQKGPEIFDYMEAVMLGRPYEPAPQRTSYRMH